MSLKLTHLGLEWFYERPGGLERYQHDVCLAHARLGVDVECWLQSKGIAKNEYSEYPVFSYASASDGARRRRTALQALAANRASRLSNDAGAVFVSHHASNSIHLLRRLRKVPHVVHFHGPWARESAYEGKSRWRIIVQGWIERQVYRRASRIITLSNAFKNVVVDHYFINPLRVTVVPGGVWASDFTPMQSRVEARRALNLPENKTIFLTVRRLVRRVGVDTLIDAIGGLRELLEMHNAIFLIAGKGPLRSEFESKTRDGGLNGLVRFLGYVPSRDLPTLYHAADVSLVPSQELEGFGLVTLESLASGTPAVVTPVGGLPEVVGGLDANLVLKGSTAEHLREFITQLLGGHIKLPCETRCIRYSQSFDWSVIAPKLLAIYGDSRLNEAGN